MREPGIQPPSASLTVALGHTVGHEFARFVSILADTYPKMRSFTPSINPASVSAGSESTQTFTINGLTANDVVTVNKPTRTAGLDIVQAWASADTLHLTFQNTTGAPIDAGSETYRIIAVRL